MVCRNQIVVLLMKTSAILRQITLLGADQFCKESVIVLSIEVLLGLTLPCAC